MKSALHCQLLLPGMFPPPGAVAPALPALRKLLRCARREDVFAGGPQAWLCRLFGVARQQDWPVAPFAALADGLPAETGYWLCADPVSLLLQRDSFTVTDGPRALSLAQAQRLAEALNAHFAADSVQFFAPRADRWYLRLPQVPLLQTYPLSQALGRDIHARMPQGADSLKWLGWLNEVQMLLHGHPVNLALEEQGEPPVNSLWLWGGGVLPAVISPAGIAFCADDPLARGLALAHGNTLAPLPPTAEGWRQGANAAAPQLIVQNPPELTEWPQAVQQRERDWFAPLLAMLRDGRLARLTLHLAGETVNSFTVTRGDLRKFWRSARPLETYLG